MWHNLCPTSDQFNSWSQRPAEPVRLLYQSQFEIENNGGLLTFVGCFWIDWLGSQIISDSSFKSDLYDGFETFDGCVWIKIPFQEKSRIWNHRLILNESIVTQDPRDSHRSYWNTVQLSTIQFYYSDYGGIYDGRYYCKVVSDTSLVVSLLSLIKGLYIKRFLYSKSLF